MSRTRCVCSAVGTVVCAASVAYRELQHSTYVEEFQKLSSVLRASLSRDPRICSALSVSDRRTGHAPGASSSNENRTALVMSFVWRAESRESCTIGSRMLRQCSFRYVVAMRSWNLDGSVQHIARETAYLSAISWFPA